MYVSNVKIRFPYNLFTTIFLSSLAKKLVALFGLRAAWKEGFSVIKLSSLRLAPMFRFREALLLLTLVVVPVVYQRIDKWKASIAGRKERRKLKRADVV